MNASRFVSLIVPSLLALSAHSLAAEEAPLEEPRYLELKPTFITNFDFSETGHLKYLKADVNVKTGSSAAEAAVKYHLPLMRNAIVLLLSRQDEGTVSTSEGRQEMRSEAVVKLNELLVQEEGEAYIQDVLFTNFIVQR